MSEWKKVRLGDIVAIKSGLSYKSDYIGKGENLLLGMGCVSFKDSFVESGARPYSQDCDEKYTVKPGDIVLATRQQSNNLPILAMPAIIPEKYKGIKLIVGTNLYKVDNSSDVANRFIYFVLKCREYVEYIKGVKTGTTVQMVSKRNVEDYKFWCPPKFTRDRIVAIVSRYDDLIENYQKQIKLLEEAAQRLYKEWFVDLHFPGYENTKIVDGIPEGWEKKKASDFFEMSIGKTPPRGEQQWFTKKSQGVSWVSISDMKQSLFISSTSEDLTKEACEKFNVKIVPEGTVLLSFKLTVGRVSIADTELCTNEAIAHFRKKGNNWREYTTLFLKNYNYDSLGNTSGISKAVNSTIIKNMPFVMPTESLLEDFHKSIFPTFESIRKLTVQLRLLTEARDRLLPKLMNGEIELEENKTTA